MTDAEPPSPRLWPVCVSALVAILAYGMIIPDTQVRAAELGAKGLVMGWVMASFSLAQLAFVPLMSRMSDRLGRRPVLLGSLILFVIAFATYSQVHSLPTLFAARIIAGAAMSCIAISFAYVTDVAEESGRAKAFGLLGACIGVGFILGPAIGGTVASRSAVPALALGLTATILAAANFVFALVCLRPSTAVVAEPSPQRDAIARTPGNARTLLASFLLASVAFSCLETTFVRVMTEQWHQSQAGAGRMLAWIGLFDVFAQGVLIRRWMGTGSGYRWILIGMTLHLAILWSIPSAPLWAPLLVVSALVGLGQGMYVPCLSALISRNISDRIQGGLFGLIQAISSAARVLASLVANYLFDEVAPWATYAIASSLMLPALIFLHLGMRRVASA